MQSGALTQRCVAKDLPVAEQLRRYLNSRGDMSQRSKSAGQHLSMLSLAGGATVEWALMKHADLSARLLGTYSIRPRLTASLW